MICSACSLFIKIFRFLATNRPPHVRCGRYGYFTVYRRARREARARRPRASAARSVIMALSARRRAGVDGTRTQVAIERLLHLYAYAVDSGQPALLGELFAEDMALWFLGKYKLHGKENFVK